MFEAPETQVVPTVLAESQLAVGDENAESEFELRCAKCNFPMDVQDVSSRKMGKEGVPTCKSCHHVLTMLAKQMARMPDEWDLMSPPDHVKFFQECAHLKGEHGILKYKHVRAQLVQTLVTREISKMKRSAVGEFHPMKYWVDRGYSKESVEENCEQMTHPTLGITTYRVDVFSVTKENIQEKVEETLLNCSRDVKRKHAPALPKAIAAKGKAKGGGQDQPKPELTFAQLQAKHHLESLVIDSDSDCEILVACRKLFV